MAQVSELGLFEIDQAKCEGETGKGERFCKSLIYSFKLKCLVDRYDREVPVAGQQVSAFLSHKEIARATSQLDGSVVMTFDGATKDKLHDLDLFLRNESLGVNPFVFSVVKVPMRLCEKERLQVASELELHNAPIFKMLRENAKDFEKPLGTSFDNGASILNNANPETEAESVYRRMRGYFVYYCGFSCSPPGFPPEEQIEIMKRYPHVAIPATSDYIRAERKKYFNAAQAFAVRFNLRMRALIDGSAK